MKQHKQHRVVRVSADPVQRADARALERAENEGWHMQRERITVVAAQRQAPGCAPTLASVQAR